MEPKLSLNKRLKNIIIGKPRSPYDRSLFHKLSLIAFFAWVGLGADGLTSSCYGPEEAFLALGKHTYLSIFVALGTALTILVISASYSQIIELFPSGGGGYLVASKLLSPKTGMVSGCALLIDYVLTITLSTASGADALFSFLPSAWHPLKLEFAIVIVVLLTLMNLRGVKESVVPLVPIFLAFLITHAVALGYGLISHMMNFSTVAQATMVDMRTASAEIGIVGMLMLIMRSYSMGAGTFTGIEAVSNGLPVLREPRVETGKRTMRYMAVSLALTVLGLMICYLLYDVQYQHGKTLNAVLLESIAGNWGGNSGYIFVLITLISEAVLLFVAAQTGFLDGPRVIANMALDRWFPTRFAMLSDRFVSQNGILLMGGAATILMLLARGSVKFLIVLYSINVFITFVLSQLGMVRHWWTVRSEIKNWYRKLFINGVGLFLSAFILIMVSIIKFYEGGWITLLVTGLLVAVAVTIRRHYRKAAQLLSRLDELVEVAETSVPLTVPGQGTQQPQEIDPKARTAVILVNGYNGLGLHTLMNVIRSFSGVFQNFVFVQIGAVDAGIFKGTGEIGRLENHIQDELDRYVKFMEKNGYRAESYRSIAVDVVDEITKIAPKILERFPNAIFFGGQLVFPKDSFFTRGLHNYTIFAVQRKLYNMGMTVVIMPIRVR